jgi:hypothetical protein
LNEKLVLEVPQNWAGLIQGRERKSKRLIASFVVPELVATQKREIKTSKYSLMTTKQPCHNNWGAEALNHKAKKLLSNLTLNGYTLPIGKCLNFARS